MLTRMHNCGKFAYHVFELPSANQSQFLLFDLACTFCIGYLVTRSVTSEPLDGTSLSLPHKRVEVLS